jgi:isoleucyl-tRNA synthetase
MSQKRYQLIPAELGQDALERRMLEMWRAENLFRKTLELRAGAPDFVFFEGPPTANGQPGIHHVFARTIKDLFCRHRHMRGYCVLRKAGWDTHGLPVEIEVERQLGISGKQQIEELGVEEFNRRCRESVWRYREDWEALSERIGYWLDYSDPYITYSNEYIESVWWALKTLYDRGLLYRGHRILPYCARCGTALSSHEVAQGYEDVEDPSVYLALPLLEMPAHGASDAEALQGVERRLLVWTTTPWTLLSNVALAVNPDLEYLEVRQKSGAPGTLVLAAARAEALLGERYGERWQVLARWRGRELVGGRYLRPLDWVPLPPQGRSQVIVAGDFVSAEDGSGIVHMAPAFGAEDYATAQKEGLAFLQPVNARGCFDEDIPVVGGKWVKDADPIVIAELERRGLLWKASTLTHSYPHCWRCGTPLLYYARDSWFVRTTAFKDAMLARNEKVAWHPPEVGAGRFGDWLRNNVDWTLSRDRYWGTPLPVWVCEVDSAHLEVIGSYAELVERTGQALPDSFDAHKPYIDRFVWPCARCAREGKRPHGASLPLMRRVPEVIDTWFDSGSMPFAQWHYPFENGDLFRRQYPADFIAEGVDQTRGWFYSLLAIATGLGDALPDNPPPGGTAPYRAVVVNDLVLDAKGVKMSKSRGNVVDPWQVVARYGADAVRLFLVASSQLDVPRRFDENAIRETSARFLVTLRNVYSGIFAQYANFGWLPSERDPEVSVRPPIDRWILSRARSVELEVDRLLNDFDATAAARAIMSFVVEDVSNWYVRLNRHRLYEVDGDDNRAAFATLYEVLLVVSRLLAPFAPFISDFIHRELTGQSVHVAPFLRQRAVEPDPALEGAMGIVRQLASLAHAARDKVGIGVRWPLQHLFCVVPPAAAVGVQPLLPLLAAELNVKEVTLLTSADDLVELSAKPNYRVLGQRFGRKTPLVAQAIQSLPPGALRELERGEPVSVEVEGEWYQVGPDDLAVQRRATGDFVVREGGGLVVALDPVLTQQLRREGIARELVHRIQRLRKDSGLAVSDRIVLRLSGAPEIEAAAQEYKEWIAGEVLAKEFRVGEDSAGVECSVQTVEIDGLLGRIALKRDG